MIPEQSQRSGKMMRAPISDKLLSSIIKLSMLQDDVGERPVTPPENSAANSLQASPIRKNDERLDASTLELQLSKMIFKMSYEPDELPSTDEMLQMLKLCLLRINQLNMTLNFVREDNASNTDRLELERDLLLKEISFIRNKPTDTSSLAGSDQPESYVTPITTPQKRKITIIQTTRLSSSARHARSRSFEKIHKPALPAGHKRHHSSPSFGSSSRQHPTQFFHYYSHGTTDATDFNSVDNRRNKKRRKDSKDEEQENAAGSLTGPTSNQESPVGLGSPVDLQRYAGPSEPHGQTGSVSQQYLQSLSEGNQPNLVPPNEADRHNSQPPTETPPAKLESPL